MLIPPILQTFTDGVQEATNEDGVLPGQALQVEGATIREILARLAVMYPALGAEILADHGELHPSINAFLNETDVRTMQGLDTPGRDVDTLVQLAAMPGS